VELFAKNYQASTCDAVNQKLGIVHFWDTLNFLHFSGTIIFYANNFK